MISGYTRRAALHTENLIADTARSLEGFLLLLRHAPLRPSFALHTAERASTRRLLFPFACMILRHIERVCSSNFQHATDQHKRSDESSPRSSHSTQQLVSASCHFSRLDEERAPWHACSHIFLIETLDFFNVVEGQFSDREVHSSNHIKYELMG